MRASLGIFLLGCTLLACGGEVELRPELEAQLDEYEGLIDRYQTKFAAVRNDPPAFKRISDDYSRDLQTWMARMDEMAPTLSAEEGRAFKARIEVLNERAVTMLTGI